MLHARDLEYDLPEKLVATRPVEPRDAARLMVVDRAARRHEDMFVRDLPGVLAEGDVLVFNSSRVLPARLLGRRVRTGGTVEGLFLSSPSPGVWTCLFRGGHLRPGVEVVLLGPLGEESGVVLRLVDRSGEEAGAWLVELVAEGRHDPAAAVLDRLGRTPLPPYILKARSRDGQVVDEAFDRDRYQTVYARGDSNADGSTPGSVAAPTAGLHFTPELLSRLDRAGVQRLDVTLHVGTGTFRPVESELVQDHPMHRERCSVSVQTRRALAEARARGRRIIPVGTTSARTLESLAVADQAGELDAPSNGMYWMDTRLLILPGHRWGWCDGMMTNFHLPRSTLMAMVAAMLDGGVGALRSLYGRAIERGYRFYSYGDAMLVLP